MKALTKHFLLAGINNELNFIVQFLKCLSVRKLAANNVVTIHLECLAEMDYNFKVSMKYLLCSKYFSN